MLSARKTLPKSIARQNKHKEKKETKVSVTDKEKQIDTKETH